MTFEIICSIISFVSRENAIRKGECLYILNDKIQYYTKELIKLLSIAFIGLLMISAMIIIKYKPMYEVSINSEKLGYIENINQIDEYITEKINNKENHIAFIELQYTPEVKLALVGRKEENSLERIIAKIEENCLMQYTTYAITYNKEEKVYMNSSEEAQELIEKIKEQYPQSKEKFGILQVYSEDLEKIKPEDLKTATTKISNAIKQDKKDTTIKVAKTNEKTTTSVNGVKFTVKPLSGTITSRFGGRTSPGGIGSTNHKGLDIAAKMGTTIKAAASGTVKFAGYKGSLGNLIIIDNGNGVETYYGHCSKLYVSKGQKINAGDKIAGVGQTGAATGPHLHLEIHVNGIAVNPQKYVYQ